MSHMCFRRRQQIAVTFAWGKPSFIVFSKKSEVSVVSLLTGNKEVKMKITYFWGTYDYCRLHRRIMM